MPEAAVAHHRDGALLHHRRHRAGRGERHAEAQDRVAEIERRQGGEGVAADVARDVNLAEFTLQKLDRREHRPFGTADAEAGRPARAASKRSRGRARSMSLADWAKNFSRPSVTTSAVYSPAISSTSLP